MTNGEKLQIFVELIESEDLLPGNTQLGITSKTITTKQYIVRVPQCSIHICTNDPVQASQVINHYLNQ